MNDRLKLDSMAHKHRDISNRAGAGADMITIEKELEIGGPWATYVNAR
jgi:hypothetical protein